MQGSAEGRDGVARPLIVYYNTRCPVCRTGIDRQRNRLFRAVRAGAIEFRDINLEPDALAHVGIGLEAIRRRLHGLEPLGRLVVGIDCAIEIWRRTPGEAWLAGLMSTSGVHRLAQWSYDRFADILYAWNRRNGHW